MSGSDHHHGGPGAGDDPPADDDPVWSDRVDAPDGILLYALATYAVAFRFVPETVEALVQVRDARLLAVAATMVVLVGWGVALVGLVKLRLWGWVGSLVVHGVVVLLTLLAGDVLATAVLAAAGFYLLSKGSLYTDGDDRPPGTA